MLRSKGAAVLRPYSLRERNILWVVVEGKDQACR
jgi:hypothetical protein